jgi:type 1 fimbriae regulatory protein FimB/type 1 fimbriae regulatory protein FimE
MAKSAVLRTVAVAGRRVGRRSDADYGRERRYLTPAEVELLIATARKRGRYGQRDALAILMCYRHGLRVSELVALRWSQIAWEGTPRLHPALSLVERMSDTADRALATLHRH